MDKLILCLLVAIASLTVHSQDVSDYNYWEDSLRKINTGQIEAEHGTIYRDIVNEITVDFGQFENNNKCKCSGCDTFELVDSTSERYVKKYRLRANNGAKTILLESSHNDSILRSEIFKVKPLPLPILAVNYQDPQYSSISKNSLDSVIVKPIILGFNELTLKVVNIKVSFTINGEVHTLESNSDRLGMDKYQDSLAHGGVLTVIAKVKIIGENRVLQGKNFYYIW
jgi:hypothetical protein